MAERQTFAFEVQAPVQGRPSAQGGGQIAQTVGGQVMGGDRSGVNTNGADVFGGFLDGLLAPYAERKAKEQFAKGVTDQMYAEAGKEVRAGNGLLTKIFGPTAYEEGAVFYEAQKRISEAQSAWAAREDELKRMSSDEVAKQWADHLEATKVGDYYLDQMISDEMLKASPQMLQSVAKANYKYEQEKAAKSQADAWDAGADAFQNIAASFSATADPSAEQVAGYNSAAQSFLQTFIPVKGQTDESYVKNLTNVMRRFAQKGNGHALTALMRSGASDVLELGDRVKIEDFYNRYGKQAVARAAAAPEVMGQINALERELARDNIDPEAALLNKRRINETIKRQTGFDVDLYDVTDQTATLRNVWQGIVAEERRTEDWQREVAKQEDQQQHELELEQIRAERDATAADMAFASDSPGVAIASGAVKSDALNMRILQGYMQNDFAGMNRVYKDGIITPTVKDAIQNTINTHIASGYSAEFDNLSQKFDAMMKTNPAMAKEYFGPAFVAMRQYQKIGRGPQAFAMAFGNASQYQPSGSAVAKGQKDVKEWVDKQQPGFVTRAITGAWSLNASGRNTLARLIGSEVAMDASAGGADLSEETLRKSAYDRVINNGMFEQYGPMAWSNPAGTRPLWRDLGVPRDVADQVILGQIDASLRNRGFEKGISGAEYQITRTSRAGKPVLLVVPVDDEGNMLTTKAAAITIGQLQAAAKTHVKEQKNKPPLFTWSPAARAIGKWATTAGVEQQRAATATKPKPANPGGGNGGILDNQDRRIGWSPIDVISNNGVTTRTDTRKKP